MLKAHAYVLVGRDKIGKTSIQRGIWSKICRPGKDKILKADKSYRLRQGPDRIFFSDSSIQEKNKPNKYVDYYYHETFKGNSAICILSSHADFRCDQQVRFLIDLLKRDSYNTCGIFFSNSWETEEQRIAGLDWHETFWIDNHQRESSSEIQSQLDAIVDNLSNVIEGRALALLP